MHRNELSGVLGGLTRVRSFSIDDAHIYCAPDQLEDEILGVMDLVFETYRDFGFEEFEMELSTRRWLILTALFTAGSVFGRLTGLGFIVALAFWLAAIAFGVVMLVLTIRNVVPR